MTNRVLTTEADREGRKRRNFPAAVKRAALERAAGKCEECKAPLVDGQYDYDHVLADGICGEPSLDNCAVICKGCHGYKTRKHDIPAIARAKRLRLKHEGKWRPSRRPMPGGRDSDLKRAMSRKTVKR